MASIVSIKNWQGSSNAQSTDMPEATPDMKQMGAIVQQRIDRQYNDWRQQKITAARAQNADMASVGYDKDKYAALIASGAGLSQMSDHEREYITSRYQATNPFDRKEYTDSVVDQYLASVGMPSSKELNNYRKAYYDYVSAGGVKENFGELYNDTDAVAWMRDKWASETKTGANGQRIDSKGKNITYADTLLDRELFENELMPSDQVESYYQRYKEYRATQDKIDRFYTEVYNSSAEMRERATGSKGDKSTQQIFYEMLAKPEYQDLAQYIPTATALPDRNSDKYAVKDELGLNVIGFDEDAYNADYLKAVTSRAKSDKTYDWDISYSGYEQYTSDRSAYEREQKQARENAALAESTQKWFSTPALSEKEKEQRRTDVEKFLRVFGSGEYDISAFDSYFQMLDVGVPQDVLVQGYAAISEWNETENAGNPSKYADIKLQLEGYSPDDGDYAANKRIVEQTKRVASNQAFDLLTEYDPMLYDKQVKVGVVNYGSGSLVSPEGAVYAAVNGRQYASIDPKADDKTGSVSLLLSLSRQRSGKSVMSYMTNEEIGVFNFLFRHSPEEGIQYLDGLYDMLEDRQDIDANGTFAQRLTAPGVEVSKQEISDYVYDQSLHLYEEQLETVNEGGTSARKRDAWQAYRGYSDEELQKLYEFHWNRYQTTPLRGGGDVELEAQMNRDQEIAEDIQDILDKRAALRTEADVYASLYDYTEAEGEKATAENDHASNIGHASDGLYRSGMTNGEAFGLLLQGGWSDLTEQAITAQMTDAQRNRYNWLYENKGRETAAAYYNLLRDHLDEQAAGTIEARYKAEASENKVGYSLLSIPGTFASGLTALTGTMLNLATGTEVTRSQAAAWDFSSTWREGVTEEMTPFGSFVYGTGMSMADSGVSALLSAVGGGDVGLIGLASSAYASALHAALDRGLDSKAATQTAIAAGIAEYITEKIGLETLLNAIEGMGKGAVKSFGKDFLLEVGKQALVEGSEEVAADVLNLAADALINGDRSELSQNIDALIDAGYSRDEAARIAWGDQIKNTALSFAGGALSGGLMTAGGGGIKLGSSALRLAGQMNRSARTGADVAGTIGSSDSAQAGASVRTREGEVSMYDHLIAFDSGKQAADRLFGEDTAIVRQNMQHNTGDGDYVSRISSIANKLSNLNNTDYLYGYLFDAEGNALVSEDGMIAIASAFASMGEDVNVDNLDAVWSHFMAAKQSNEQRGNNTNYGKIKTAQGVRELVGNIHNALSEIVNAQQDHAAKVTDAKAKLNDSEARLRGVEAKLNALDINSESYAKDYMALQASRSVLLTEINNHRVTLDTVTGRDARQLEQNIAGMRQEIERNQSILDQHYASLSTFLNEYAPNALGGANVALRNVNGRAKNIETKIDSVIASDMDNDSKRQALRELRDRLADANADRSRLNARLSNDDPGALTAAMQAAKSGSVSEFIRQQASAITPVSTAANAMQETQQQTVEAQTAPNAAESAQTAQAENPTSATANTEESARDAVKQDDATESEPTRKRTTQIGRATQKILSRVARRFGCEVVWGSSDTVVNEKTGETLGSNNGAYNPDQPNRIYLNTTMVGAKVMSDMQIAAREVFTHEVLHYVANTTTYFNIENAAMSYYDALYKDAGGIRTVLGAMMAAEGYDETHAREEATARFVESVLFADERGTKRALTWLARSDKGMVGNFLTAVEYLIKSSNARTRSGDSATVLDQMLLDAELNLAVALKERDYLDKAGLSGITQQRRESMLQEARQEQTGKADAQTEPSDVMQSNGKTIQDYLTQAEKFDANKYGLTDKEVVDGKNHFLTVEETATAKKRGVSLDWAMQNKFKDLKLEAAEFGYARELGITPGRFATMKADRKSALYKLYGTESDSFVNQLNKWAEDNKRNKKTKDRQKFFVGKLSDVYEPCGITNEELFFTAQKMLDIKKKHKEMSNRTIGKLDRIINDPVLIMFSKDEDNINRLVVYGGNVYAENGLPVMVALEPNAREYGRDIFASRLMSAYTRCSTSALNNLVASEEYKKASAEKKSEMMREVGRKNDATQSLLDSSELLWVNPDKKITDKWISHSRLQLPLGATYGYNGRLAHLNDSVNPQNSSMKSNGTTMDEYAAMATPEESVSDIRDIFRNKSKGTTGTMKSNGRGIEEYVPLDFSKSTITREDGEPYDELYHGGWGLGYGIEAPALADDFHSIFLTDSLNVAKSYTDKNAATDAVEFDPRNEDPNRAEKEDTKRKWLSVKRRYGAMDNLTVLSMVYAQSEVDSKTKQALEDVYATLSNKEYAPDPTYYDDAFVDEPDIPDWAYEDSFDEEVSEESERLEWTQEAIDEMGDAVDYASELLDMIQTLATKHSQEDQAAFMDAYNRLSDILNRLAPYDESDFEYVHTPEGMGFDPDDIYFAPFDFKTGMIDTSALAEKPVNTDEMRMYMGLKGVQRSMKDAVIDGELFQALQSADGNSGGYIGFDNVADGKARLFTESEKQHYLPRHEGEINGYYKANAYGENTLHLNGNGTGWSELDPMSMPENVRRKLGELYGYSVNYNTRKTSRAARELGYDSVIFHDLVDIGAAGARYNADGEAADIIIVFNENQVKSTYNENPTTNPHMMKSNGMSIDDYVRLYGQKAQNAYGEANNIRTPQYVDNLDQPNGRRYRVSDAAQTLKEVPHIQQSVREMIDSGIVGQADGILERHGIVYEPITLNRMREIGAQYIAEHGGLTQSMYDLTRDMPRAAARDLVQYMSAANQVFTEIGAGGTFDADDYYEFVASYIEMRSIWGRVGRAMQLVNDSPLGRVAYWNRVVNRVNEKNRTAVDRGLNRMFYRDGYTDIVIPQEYFDALSQAQTQDEINAAENQITQYIGEHSPLTVSDALRNWRYFSMLANPVTHARNMLGNTTMLGGRIVKDTIAAGMENVAVRMGLMNESERRHAVVLRESAAVRDYVRQLWNDNGDAVQSGGRNGFDDRLSDAVRKSPFRIVDRAMRFNGNALESEDRLFLYSTFTAATSQYIAAQNIDVNNITREQQGAIVQYATQQAQEATYRDASYLADTLNQIARRGGGYQFAVDAVMPFKKTPINIAKRGIEYSPAGLAKGLIDIARNASSVQRGGEIRVSASTVVDELAKGITGTMLAAIGFFLARCGILKVSAGDGDRDSAFERDIGRQDYSLEIGDLSIKIESLAPLTFPLFMGAQLQRMTSEEWNGLQLSDLTDAAMSMADPLMDMSFMSSLNDVLSTYNENKIGGVLENAASAYIGQYLPTIGSKINQTVNATRRTAKSSQASPIGTTWDYRLRSWASKIPVLNQAVLEPYVTTTGEYDTKDSFGDYLLAFSNNFLSPVNVQIVDTAPVNREIARLVEATGQTDFVPQNPKKYLTIGGERYDMTAKEYTQYSKEHNETVYALLSYVIQSDAYANATEEQRVSLLEKAYDKAHTAMMDKYKAIFAQK